jgi:hypothetical protein
VRALRDRLVDRRGGFAEALPRGVHYALAKPEPPADTPASSNGAVGPEAPVPIINS